MLSGDQSSLSTFRLGMRPKLVLTFALQTIVVALLIIAIEQWRVRSEIRQQTLEHAQALATTVAAASGNAVRTGRNDDLRDIINGLRKNPSIEYADFIAPGGAVIAASQPVPPPGMTEIPGRADLTLNGEEQHLFVVPLRAAEGSHASLRLLVNERQASDTARSLAWTNLLIALLALAVASALAWGVSRVMIRPILDLVSTASEIAGGNLTQRAEITSGDEMGSLASAFNAMAGSLEKTVLKLVRSQTQLKTVVETVGSRSRTVIDRVDEQRGVLDDTYHSIDQMNGGVRKITDNVEALSAASEETSSSMLQMVASIEEVSRHTDTLFSSVEETASATHQMANSIREVDQNVDFLSNFATETSSSMVEMSASIAQVEANAARSYELNVAVAEAAESGMRAVRETIDGMEQIRHSVRDSNAVITRLGERSAAIGRILNVIEDVAEQTNLLALNAAILAAQAGEHGKGFSVVATEIRDLSERTASSTREITGLIHSVQAEVANALKSMGVGTKLVEGGVALSHEAGKALNNILESATKASGMGREIAAATREQASGSESVTRSVERLQELVKQISNATSQQSQGSNHIMRAVESMREVTKYVRQAMTEQRSGSSMISAAAERMIDMIHEIFKAATNQASESERIVATMEQVRAIAEGNRSSANEMTEALHLLSDAIRSVDEEVKRFRVRA